jgi:hypothetical protein
MCGAGIKIVCMCVLFKNAIFFFFFCKYVCNPGKLNACSALGRNNYVHIFIILKQKQKT